MQVPEGVTDYCTTYADCATRFPDLMAKWDAFYQVHTPHNNTQTTQPQAAILLPLRDLDISIIQLLSQKRH